MIITGITITKQMNIQLPNLARGRQSGRAPLIIRTPVCSHTLGWFELTYWAVPVTLRVNHFFSAVYKQSFIPSIMLWSALCEQVAQVFSASKSTGRNRFCQTRHTMMTGAYCLFCGRWINRPTETDTHMQALFFLPKTNQKKLSKLLIVYGACTNKQLVLSPI